MGLIEKSMLERWEIAKIEARLDKAKSIKQQEVCCTSNITDDKAPTIDAEPVRHGRWIFKEMDELVPTGELGVAEGHHIHLSSGATFKPNEKGIIVLKEHKRVKKPYCSECGDHGDDEYDATPYCPNCGAKMDLKEGESE